MSRCLHPGAGSGSGASMSSTPAWPRKPAPCPGGSTGRTATGLFASRMIEILDRCHGQVTGMFTGDECLAGKSPIQGTELCAVVEFLYSLEVLMSVFGEPAWGDRLERVAFNALPATFTPDMWAHQYDQQVNQVQCTINPDHMWTTNGPESNLYGLEPNYGCCTSNMHQGWPKFCAHLWMKTPGEGIAAVAYAPSTARFQSRGVPVSVSLETDYPFRESLQITVKPDRPVRFPLSVARAGVGGGCHSQDCRPIRDTPQTGIVPSGRAGMERYRRARPAIPDESQNQSPLQRRPRHRTRPAGLLPLPRGNLDQSQCRQAAPATSSRRLRGPPCDALELWAARGRQERGGRPALRGATGRRAAVLARRRRHDGRRSWAGNCRTGSWRMAGRPSSHPGCRIQRNRSRNSP